MKKLIATVLILSLVGAAAPVSAQPWFNSQSGTLIGGVTGAVIGSQIGGSPGARIGAGIAGALIGGVLGNAIGSSFESQYSNNYYNNGYRYQSRLYRGDCTLWRYGECQCRHFKRVIYRDGYYYQTIRGEVCQSNHGYWDNVRWHRVY